MKINLYRGDLSLLNSVKPFIPKKLISISTDRSKLFVELSGLGVRDNDGILSDFLAYVELETNEDDIDFIGEIKYQSDFISYIPSKAFSVDGNKYIDITISDEIIMKKADV